MMNTAHTYHVKNMVCQRCILIVKNILEVLGIEGNVSMGKIEFQEKLSMSIQNQLMEKLEFVGLEIIEGRMQRLMVEVKLAVSDYLSLGFDSQRYKLSKFISSKVSYDFNYLSDQFSKIEGLTIERYFILQRLEKVKELMTYDQLSLSEIAFETGFSSVHHLSAQFKKILGITPSQYKSSAVLHRQPLDLVGV
jgi:AraC family transcriptional regulator